MEDNTFEKKRYLAWGMMHGCTVKKKKISDVFKDFLGWAANKKVMESESTGANMQQVELSGDFITVMFDK